MDMLNAGPFITDWSKNSLRYSTNCQLALISLTGFRPSYWHDRRATVLDQSFYRFRVFIVHFIDCSRFRNLYFYWLIEQQVAEDCTSTNCYVEKRKRVKRLTCSEWGPDQQRTDTLFCTYARRLLGFVEMNSVQDEDERRRRSLEAGRELASFTYSPFSSSVLLHTPCSLYVFWCWLLQ